MKKSTITKREKFARDSIAGAEKKGRLPFYHFEETNGKQYVCNAEGTTAYSFVEKIGDIPPSDHISLARIFEDAKSTCINRLELPTLADLKTYIKDMKTLGTPKTKVMYDFGKGKPCVKAMFLVEAMEMLESLELYYTPNKTVNLYGRTEQEYSSCMKNAVYDEVVICPIRVKQGVQREVTDIAAIHEKAESVRSEKE